MSLACTRRLLPLVLAATPWVATLAPAPALAADPAWPAARPIRVVIPAGPGSGTDIFARMIGHQLSQTLQQTLVYDNKPGANGILGNDAVAKAPPDGYTILFSNASAVALNPITQPKLPYQTLKDLAPVAQVGAGGVLMAVSSDVPVKDLEGLIKYVKARPDKLAYGSWGSGSTGHLLMEALKSKTGMRMTHVPYKTMGQLLTDLQGGTLGIATVDVVSSLPLIKSGKLVPLAVTGSRRLPKLAEVPTTQELGYRLGGDGWYGVFAPGGTPAAIVQRLNAEINRILTNPALTPTFESFNMASPPIKTAPEFERTVQEDIEAWREIASSNRLVFD